MSFIWQQILAWSIYFVIHSFLAGQWMKNRVPMRDNHYRLGYNMLAAILLGVVFYTTPILGIRMFNIPRSCQYISIPLFVFCIWFGIRLTRETNWSSFIGWTTDKKAELVTTGMYSLCRHPMYFLYLMLLLSGWLVYPSQEFLLTILIHLIYILIGARFEENRMVAIFPGYNEYRRNTPFLLPSLKKIWNYAASGL